MVICGTRLMVFSNQNGFRSFVFRTLYSIFPFSSELVLICAKVTGKMVKKKKKKKKKQMSFTNISDSARSSNVCDVRSISQYGTHAWSAARFDYAMRFFMYALLHFTAVVHGNGEVLLHTLCV